ncbi:hypothetical protein Psi01_36730 [Planobispora siamensis]|uniref:Uncharacterized protein n=1 Tax=Planobispora siamensis TaxID=936338 RepID=A0A8J3SNX5_9ACTN|nr:hypothetical protein Psi01_36730 [Planobispora siamensis]
MAALWAEPAAPAAAISETAPHAAVRRVRTSWSMRVTDMVVCSFEAVTESVRGFSRTAEPFMAQPSRTALIPGRHRPDAAADTTARTTLICRDLIARLLAHV